MPIVEEGKENVTVPELIVIGARVRPRVMSCAVWTVGMYFDVVARDAE